MGREPLGPPRETRKVILDQPEPVARQVPRQQNEPFSGHPGKLIRPARWLAQWCTVRTAMATSNASSWKGSFSAIA